MSIFGSVGQEEHAVPGQLPVRGTCYSGAPCDPIKSPMVSSGAQCYDDVRKK